MPPPPTRAGFWPTTTVGATRLTGRLGTAGAPRGDSFAQIRWQFHERAPGRAATPLFWLTPWQARGHGSSRSRGLTGAIAPVPNRNSGPQRLRPDQRRVRCAGAAASNRGRVPTQERLVELRVRPSRSLPEHHGPNGPTENGNKRARHVLAWEVWERPRPPHLRLDASTFNVFCRFLLNICRPKRATGT